LKETIGKAHQSHNSESDFGNGVGRGDSTSLFPQSLANLISRYWSFNLQLMSLAIPCTSCKDAKVTIEEK
jgi:hypothetical protein